jgi:uncharacterized surface protein with fasciclin (FAS1) repeats
MNNYKKLFSRIALALAAPLLLGLASCSEDIDESNLYTFTGETIEDYLANRSDKFSDFNYILKRAGMDKILSAYGTYTCFAPTNEAVEEYIDSLYDDTSNADLPHNGMTARSLEGLSDSLCNDIALFHLSATKVMAINMQNGLTIRTMLGRDINTNVDSISGNTMVNSYSMITSMDNELENGVVQEISNVLRRSNRLVSGEMERHPDLFSIWSEALALTHLGDSLTDQQCKCTEVANSYKFYTPEYAILGYTIFAETDETLKANGINNVNDLITYANSVYEHCADQGSGWYDYYRDNNIKVSTGTDYSSPYNCLNMFLRYHIVKCRVPYKKLVVDWNQVSKVPLYEYWETMLPMTLVKTLRSTKAGSGIFLNRYEANNTLTDQVAELGSDAIHQVVDGHSGILVRTDNIQALNGYIHPITGMLVYESWVPRGVLNERIRFDTSAMIPELTSASLRDAYDSEINALNSGQTGTDGNLGGNYVRIPVDYSDNLIFYNGENTRLYYLPGHNNNWRNYQGDEFNGKGTLDLAFRLPPVPDGTYELRIGLSINGNRGMYQFYLGEGTNNRTKMEALDIPVDMRLNIANNTDGTPDVTTGWTLYTREQDMGVESDKSMHNLGWMRGLLYYTTGVGGTELGRASNAVVRRILTRREFKQGNYWLRVKAVLDDDSRQMHFDYMELCPVNVYNNSRYLEDMY